MARRSVSFFIATSAALLLLATCRSPSAGTAGSDYNWATTQRPEIARSYSSFLIGRFASLTNDPRAAAKNYAAAIRNAPEGVGLTERAVFAALLTGDMETAVAIAGDASDTVLDTASLARITLGVDRLRDGDGRAASTYFSSGEDGPFNAMVASGLNAWAVYEADGFAAADAALLATQSSDNLRQGVNAYTRGLMLIAAGDDDAALETFEAIWDDGVRFAVAAETHARLLAVAGDRSRALEILTVFADDVGRNPAIEVLRSKIEAGREISSKHLTAQQGAALAVYAPAAALAAQTQGDVAGVYFALALALDPELDVTRTLWGKALDEAGRRLDAIAILQDVPETSAFYASARGQIAWALRREGDNDAALLVAAEALAAHPDRDLKVQLGDLYRSLDRHGESELIFDQIIKADAETGRTDWRLLYARGVAREQMGRWPEAEVDLKAALELQPESADILNYLGYSWIDRNKHLEEGLDLIRKAVALRPGSGYIVDSLGWAHYRLGHYDRAVRYLEQAVELTPQDAVLNDHLGDAYWHVGRRLEAAFQWSRALTLEPGEDAETLLQAKLEHGLVEDAAGLAASGEGRGALSQNP